jgi:hypothetical protein
MLKKSEMWAVLFAALLFASPTLSWCQSADLLDAQAIVHRALVQIAKGAYNSENEKQVRRLGDAASVAFTKEIGDRQVKWTDIENFLFLVHEAFATPEAIQNQRDRKPKTSLFVLRSFDCLPVASELKRSIADTKNYLEARQ